MIRRLFGINIAVRDLDTAAKKYSEVLGIKPRPFKPEEFAFPGLKGVMFRLGEVAINLIASEQPDTSIARFVESKGEGVFLISLEVDDVEQKLKELPTKGVQLVTDKPLPFAGGRVIFSHPKSMHGVQMEFIQPQPGWPE